VPKTASKPTTLNDGEFIGVDLADLLVRLQAAEGPAQGAIRALDATIAAAPADPDAVTALDPQPRPPLRC
jgi:hypothetical protein